MRNKKRKIIFALITVLALSIGCFFGTAFSAYATSYEYTDDGATVKRLTDEYNGTNPVILWQAAGNTEAYNQRIWEYITDAEEQADYGDVTVHTGDTDGVLGVSEGGFGMTKWSATKEKAAYNIDGLSIKFYSYFKPTNDTGDMYFVFDKNYGSMHSKIFFVIGIHFASDTSGTSDRQVQTCIFFQTNDEGGYTWGTGGEPGTGQKWLKWMNNFGNDFNINDETGIPGSLNELKFEEREEGHLCGYLNGVEFVDLSDVNGYNLVEDVIAPSGDDGMYFGLFSFSDCTAAIKITDIYNRKKTAVTPEEHGDSEEIEGNYSDRVKTLVNEPEDGDIKASTWIAAGDTGSYNQEIEVKNIGSQPDGGDVIVHTAIDGKDFVSTGGFGMTKHSETFERATWGINGLTVKFYSYVGGEYTMAFQNNSSTGVEGRFFAITFNNMPALGESGNVYVKLFWQSDENGGETWDGEKYVLKTASVYHNDYDYFSDPAAGGSGEFKGTQNVLYFYLAYNDHVWLALNGESLFDLSELGVISDVVVPSNRGEGMYIQYYTLSAIKACLKVTDVYNHVLDCGGDGVPLFYVGTEEGDMSYSLTPSGLFAMKPADGGNSFGVSYKKRQYLSMASVKFSFSGSEGDTLDVTFGSALTLSIEIKTRRRAVISLYSDDTLVSEDEFTFYSNGVTVNNMAIEKAGTYYVSVNDEQLEGSVNYEGNENVFVRFSVKGDCVLTPVGYISSKPEDLPGQIAEGNFEKGASSFYSSGAGDLGAFTVRLTQKLLADSVVVNFYHGKYAGDNAANNFSITLGSEGETKIILEFFKESGTPFASVSVKKDGKDKTVLAKREYANYSWNYDKKEIAFYNDSGVFMVTCNSSTVFELTDGKSVGELKAAVGSITNKMATVVFGMGYGKQQFGFISYGWGVETSVAASSGWTQGGYGSLPKYACTDGKDVGTLMTNGYAYIYSGASVSVDGFRMEYSSFVDYGKDFSFGTDFIIAPGINWYSNNVQAGTSAAFSLQIRKQLNGDKVLAKVRCQYKYDNYVTYALNQYDDYFDVTDIIRYDSNVDNVITLGRNAQGKWRWTINGVVIEGSETGKWTLQDGSLQSVPDELRTGDYSDLYDLVYSEGGFAIGGEKGAGYLQIDSGSGIMYRINYLSINNKEPVYSGVRILGEFKTGTRYMMNASKLFIDEDGDVLTFSLADDGGISSINGNTLKIFFISAGYFEITVQASDGRGGTGVAVLTFNATGDSVDPSLAEAYFSDDSDYYSGGGESGGSDDERLSCSGRVAGIIYLASILGVCLAIFAIKKLLTSKK